MAGTLPGCIPPAWSSAATASQRSRNWSEELGIIGRARGNARGAARRWGARQATSARRDAVATILCPVNSRSRGFRFLILSGVRRGGQPERNSDALMSPGGEDVGLAGDRVASIRDLLQRPGRDEAAVVAFPVDG